MLYVQLDVNWVNNPKVARAGLDGAGLHATCMCLAKSLETDGWIDLFVLARYGNTDGLVSVGELVDRLVRLNLLDRDGDRVRPHDWLARNPSQAAIGASRASKVRAGRAGNHKRYGHLEPLAECSQCGVAEPPQTPSVLAPAIAEPRTDLAALSHPPRPEPYPKPEPYTEPAAACASDPARTADQRQGRLAAAAEIIGERAATRPETRNPTSMRRAVAKGVITDRHTEAYAIIAADPSITAADLAEQLEPTPLAVPEPYNISSHLLPVDDVVPWGGQHWEEGATALADIRAERGWAKPATNPGA